jgi:hypothetical protein
VLPDRPGDNQACGSGAAGSWTGHNQNRKLLSDLASRSASGARAGIHVFHDIPDDILIDIIQIYYDFRI